MKKLLSCKFNTDTACVELRYSDGSLLAIWTAMALKTSTPRPSASARRWITWSTMLHWSTQSWSCAGMWNSSLEVGRDILAFSSNRF